MAQYAGTVMTMEGGGVLDVDSVPAAVPHPSHITITHVCSVDCTADVCDGDV